MKTKKKPKALVLLSGGLDSRLVCKILEEQLGKDNVEAVFFMLPFGGGCCNDRFCVFRFCQKEGFKLYIIDCTKGAMFRKYMGMIRKPKFQRGTAMNPCIDCHLFMLKEAKKLAKKRGADFLATGEVLGERPLSQHRGALELIESEAGLGGKVLRPLSAKLLPLTEAERKCWIDRSKLLDIRGRGRKRQIGLAGRYGIDYPMPGGGCLLTDKEFSVRLLEFLWRPDFSPNYIELARLGRYFFISRHKAIVIVGRNHQENIRLQALAKRLKLPALEVKGFMGPTTLITGKKASRAALRAAAMLTARYSDAPKGGKCTVLVKSGKNVSKTEVIAPHDTSFLGKA